MSKTINQDYIEDLITYNSIMGNHREVVFNSVVEYLSEDTIKKDTNRMILFGAKEFYEEHKRVPTIQEIQFTVVTEDDRKMMSDFIRGYKKFAKEKDLVDLVVLMKYVEEFIRQRMMTASIEGAFLKLSSDEEVDIADVYADIEGAMSVCMMDDLGFDLFGDYKDYVEYLESEDAMIPTGFPWLDEQLGGGLLATGSALYTICAQSNIGKSNMLKSISCNISKQGKNVLVISLEMPRYIYANRFVSEMADLNLTNIKDESSKVTTFLSGGDASGYGKVVIKDFPTGSLTSPALNAYIDRVEKSMNVEFDAIFLDYPELMKATKNFGTRHDLMVASLYIETRGISCVRHKPIVCVAQLNRDAYDKEKPSMQNIGSALGIATTSDWCGFMYANDELKALNQFGLSIGKSRFNAVGRSHRYNVNENTLAITESTAMDMANPMELEDVTGDGTNPDDFFNEIFGSDTLSADNAFNVDDLLAD